MGRGLEEDLESPVGENMRSTDKSQSPCPERNKRALTLFLVSAVPCGPRPSWHLGRPVTSYTGHAAHAPAQQKKSTCSPRLMDPGWALSRAWRVGPVKKQTAILPTYPTLSFHPNPGPQRGKTTTTTHADNCTTAVSRR